MRPVPTDEANKTMSNFSLRVRINREETFVMAAAVGGLDEAIKEYLLYRGFTQSLKWFEQERKDDKDKGFRVNRIVDYILQCIFRSDFNSLQNFWHHLNKRFFSRLTYESLNTAYRIETYILRLYLVHASRQGRQDEVKAFFEKMSDALRDKKEWKDWFSLPFIKNPEQNPTFKLYYSREWLDTFTVTIHNFFSTLFTCLLPEGKRVIKRQPYSGPFTLREAASFIFQANALPALLNFEAEHQKIHALATENNLLHTRLATTQQSLVEAESSVQRLEAKLAQQEAKLALQVAAAAKKSGGKSGKPTSKPSGVRQKTSSFAVASPVKKTTSLEERVEKPDHGASSPQKEVKGVGVGGEESPLKKRPLSMGALDDQKEGEMDPNMASPNADGNTPFLPVSQETYPDHRAPITHCKFSPNATRVATVDTDGVMRIWDPSCLSTSSTVELRSSLLSLDWAPQSESLVLMGSGDGVVKLFDSSTSKYHWEVNSDPKYPNLSSSTFAFSAAAAPSPTHTGSRLTFGLTAPSLPSQRASSSEMHLLNKGGGGGVGGGGGEREATPPPGGVFIWDLKTQKQKCSLPVAPNPVGVNCMAFNHNSNLLVTGGADGVLRIYDVFQKECLCGWKAHEGEVFNVQFSSDETTVYSMGRDKKFCQWSIIMSGKKVTEFQIHESACQPAVGWAQTPGGQYYPNTPRGNLFAFESEDKFVLTCSPQQALIYQVGAEGSLTKTLSITGHNGPVTCVDWLQGRRSFSTCITGSTDCTIRVTNLLKNIQE